MLTLSKIFILFLLYVSIAYAENLPTIHQIYQAAESGNLESAHAMVDEVLKAHPQSAKAHFVNAEIVLRQGDIAKAKSELAIAQQLAPGLPFAKPSAVESLKRHLAQNTVIIPSVQKQFPWMMLIAGIAVAVLIWLIMRSLFSRRSDINGSQNYNGYGAVSHPQNNNGPYGPSGYGAASINPMQSGGGLGSSIASGLATGAAAGVGIVAGEALIHHFMDGSSEPNAAMNHTSDNQERSQQSDYDMGGGDFGMNDSSSWDDSSSDGFNDSGDDSW